MGLDGTSGAHSGSHQDVLGKAKRYKLVIDELTSRSIMVMRVVRICV